LDLRRVKRREAVEEEINFLCSSPNINQGDQKKESGMGGTCSTCVREEKYAQNFSVGNLNGRDHITDLLVNWKIILKRIF
jgi:hypothetical protein